MDTNPQPQPLDSNQDTQTEEVGIISYPPGLSSDWIIRKTKHLNDAFKTWFSKDLLNIEDNYRLYEIKQVAGTLPNGTTIPRVTSIVDTMTSRFVSSLVPREQFVDGIAVDPSSLIASDHNKQEVVTDFVNETISTTKDFADKCDEAFKTLLIENVCLVETKWTIETKEDMKAVRSPDPMLGAPMPQPDPMTGAIPPAGPAPMQPIIGMNPISYEVARPDFDPLSVRMCAWDPRVKDKVNQSPWFRKRTMVSINGLFQLQQDGIIQDVDEVTKKSNKSMTPENPSDPDAKQSQAVDNKQLPSVGWDDGVWELDTWWATLAWKDDQGQFQTGKYEFWIVGGDTVVKFRENILKPQRIPIVTVKNTRVPSKLMGQGPVNVVKEMQKDLNNNMANLGQLNKNAAYSPTFYEPVSGLDGRRVSLQSNALIPVLSVNGIKRFEPAVQAIELLTKYIEFIIGQMNEATAANNQAQGIENGRTDQTATEAQILASGSNTRFGYLTEMINASMFGGIAEEYFLLWKQFGQPGQMVVKDGSNEGKGYQIQPEDLEGCYVFKPVPTQTQQAKLQHFNQLKGLVQDLMQLQAQAPQMLTDGQGQMKQLDLYDFLTTEMLPLIGVQPRGLFKNAPPPPPPQMMGPGQPPMPGQGPPQGGPPIPQPSPTQAPQMALAQAAA